MKLYELTGYKKYKDMKLGEILMKLAQDNSFTEAKGTFAITIIPDNKPYVYKLWYQDNAYETYIKLVEEIPDNVFVPRIYGKAKKIKDFPIFFKKPERTEFFNDKKIKIVKIEKLKENFNYRNKFYSLIIKSIKEVNDKTYKQYIMDEIELNPEGHEDYKDHVDDLVELVGKFKQYKRDFPELAKPNDIGGNNILYRGKIPVITDPFYDHGSDSDTIHLLDY